MVRCTMVFAAILALGGCVQTGSEGLTSNALNTSAGSLSERREAIRAVKVVSAPPAGGTSLGEVVTRRCHRNFTEDAPDEAAMLIDLKMSAYGIGADAIRPTGAKKLNGLLANCWYVVEGSAEAYALPR